jgi:hypothetical protein
VLPSMLEGTTEVIETVNGVLLGEGKSQLRWHQAGKSILHTLESPRTTAAIQLSP